MSEIEELREQMRVLGSNFESMRKELLSMPQPAEPVDLGDGMFECGNSKCYAALDREWKCCPYCCTPIVWEVCE